MENIKTEVIKLKGMDDLKAIEEKIIDKGNRRCWIFLNASIVESAREKGIYDICQRNLSLENGKVKFLKLYHPEKGNERMYYIGIIPTDSPYFWKVYSYAYFEKSMLNEVISPFEPSDGIIFIEE